MSSIIHLPDDEYLEIAMVSSEKKDIKISYFVAKYHNNKNESFEILKEEVVFVSDNWGKICKEFDTRAKAKMYALLANADFVEKCFQIDDLKKEHSKTIKNLKAEIHSIICNS